VLPRCGISLYAPVEILLTAGRLNMLNAHVDPLLYNTVPYLFVDLNANSPGGHVPYNSCPALVESVRHALVNGTVHFDIHMVAQFVCGEIFSERWQAVLPEGLRKGVSCSGAITEGVRHSDGQRLERRGSTDEGKKKRTSCFRESFDFGVWRQSYCRQVAESPRRRFERAETEQCKHKGSKRRVWLSKFVSSYHA